MQQPESHHVHCFFREVFIPRFDLLHPKPESTVLDRQSRQKSSHDRRAKDRAYFVGQSVMARNLRPGPDWIPAVIIQRLIPLSYLVETAEHELWRHHVDQLKETAQ